jgi:redox-sensing transcriptional repressor
MKNENNSFVSKNQLQRFPVYIDLLKKMNGEGRLNVSSQIMADYLKLSEETVKKDFALVSRNPGKPNTGWPIQELIEALKSFLGYNDATNAVLVGVGHLGRAFLNYEGFKECGIKIVASFDSNPYIVDLKVNGIQIFSIEKMESTIPRLNAHIGIITVPESEAQEIANTLIKSGVKAIWNFAPIHLILPDNIIIQNVNLASSLAILSYELNR